MTPSLVEIAARWARDRGEALAYAFLSNGTEEAGRLTFAQLHRAASSIAAGLLEQAKAGDRALLVYEAGLDFVSAMVGCLYAGIAAVPVPAPEASQSKSGLPRLDPVVKDCGARLLLGNPRTLSMLRDARKGGAATALDQVSWVDTRELSARPASAREPPAPSLGSLAYLQYTSGSTRAPRGVMVSHENVVRHLACMQRGLGYDSSSVSICWMPHFHDYGLIEGVLLPLFNGTPAYLMSPYGFLKRPASWLEAISRFRGTHTQAFNYAYRYCASRVKPEQLAGLDLGCLRSAGNGGEPIHPDTSRAFLEAFAPSGLRREALAPVFGLAEATLLVTAVPVTEPAVVQAFDAEALGRGEVVPVAGAGPSRRQLAACGRPLPETKVAIVDPRTRRRRSAGQLGEIWVQAPGVARGYWQREEESEAIFCARIDGDEGAGGWLRTGDLGFLYEGQLYVSGREKDLVIIHGMNHSPQDIEWTVQQAHPLLRADHGAAFGVEVDGEERLCVVQEIERGQYERGELEAIANGIAEALAQQHEVPLHQLALIRRGSIPKTSSGKIQRHACRRRFEEGTLETVHVWSGRTEKAAAGGRAEAAARSGARADELIAWVRGYAERAINSRLIDERRSLPPNIVLDFGNRGLLGLQVPERWGGLELTTSDALRVYTQLAAIDPTIATLVFLHNTNGIFPILHHATPAVRDELLPMLARGRELAAFALSEPSAGSNLGALRARAAGDGEGWVIDGVKRWNGSAWAGVISVLAMQRDRQGRPSGLTGFIVRQSDPGVRIGPESLTMGIRGIVQSSVELRGVRVGRDRLLGEAGKGMQLVDHVLSHGRLVAGAVGLGVALRAAQLASRYASRREIETGLLLDNPQAGVKLGELVHRVAVDRALLLQAAAGVDAGEPLSPDVAMAVKVAATDTSFFAADLAMQLLGGRGYMENNVVPQLFRDARMLTIGEGANEALVAAIGRSVRSGDAVAQFLRAHPAGEVGEGLARRLAAASEALDRRAKAGPYEGQQAAAWHDAVRGRLAIAALGAGAAAAGGEPAAAAWAARRFEQLCGEAERDASELASALASGELKGRIDAYRELIGDLEPSAPDVDYELDPLLRREPPPVAALEEKRERLRKLLAERPAPEKRGEPGGLARTPQALEAWIVDWMGRELGLEQSELVPNRTFVRYGMDSIHAMMLVGALEDHLARRLPPTLAWDHPTIEALARHLAASDQPAEEKAPGPHLLSQIDHMPEAEIDRLLLEEEKKGSRS